MLSRMSQDISIAALHARLQQAVDQLVRADFDNPSSTLPLGTGRRIPYARAVGRSGSVEPEETAQLSPFARSFYETAGLQIGRPVWTGSPLARGLDAPRQVPYAELNRLRDHAHEILRRMDTDGDGKLGASELANLEQHVRAFYAEAYPKSDKTEELFVKRVVELLRETVR
jgi:hypothetical protein